MRICGVGGGMRLGLLSLVFLVSNLAFAGDDEDAAKAVNAVVGVPLELSLPANSDIKPNFHSLLISKIEVSPDRKVLRVYPAIAGTQTITIRERGTQRVLAQYRLNINLAND